MNANDEDRIKELLRQAMPPVGAEAEPAPGPNIDLWPAVLRRLDTQPAAQPRLNWVWFDWALLAGVLAVTVAFPASIPMLLYYL